MEEPSSVGFVKELSLIVSPFFFLFTSSSSFLCLPSPPLHLQARCHPSLLSLISITPHPTSPHPPSSHDEEGRGGGLCCGRPVYAIPLVLKWQAGDRYAILKRGLMNFWHLISCFPVNISWLAGAWSAPPGPFWSAGQEKRGPLPPLMYSPLMQVVIIALRLINGPPKPCFPQNIRPVVSPEHQLEAFFCSCFKC